MKNKIMIDEIGKQLVDFLHNESVCLKENADGRLESLNSEDNLTNRLRKEFGNKINMLPKEDNRAFGDLDIEIGGVVYPINIKMVDPKKSTTYNGGGVKVFNHVLYGGKDTNWSTLATKISGNKPKKIHSEYFYLVYYKRSDKKPVFVSLTNIHEDSIVTNPSNPIQLKKDIKVKKRSCAEKVDFMTELFGDICRKKAKPHLILEGAA
jgi:hypothetical protein